MTKQRVEVEHMSGSAVNHKTHTAPLVTANAPTSAARTTVIKRYTRKGRLLSAHTYTGVLSIDWYPS
jgi:hypothetical protein